MEVERRGALRAGHHLHPAPRTHRRCVKRNDIPSPSLKKALGVLIQNALRAFYSEQTASVGGQTATKNRQPSLSGPSPHFAEKSSWIQFRNACISSKPLPFTSPATVIPCMARLRYTVEASFSSFFSMQ